MKTPIRFFLRGKNISKAHKAHYVHSSSITVLSKSSLQSASQTFVKWEWNSKKCLLTLDGQAKLWPCRVDLITATYRKRFSFYKPEHLTGNLLLQTFSMAQNLTQHTRLLLRSPLIPLWWLCLAFMIHKYIYRCLSIEFMKLIEMKDENSWPWVSPFLLCANAFFLEMTFISVRIARYSRRLETEMKWNRLLQSSRIIIIIIMLFRLV